MCLELVNSFFNEIVAETEVKKKKKRRLFEFGWLRVESRIILFSHIYDVCCVRCSVGSLTFPSTHINRFFLLFSFSSPPCSVSYMWFSFLIFTRWCRKKMEIIECWRVDLHRMDSPLFAILGDGSCSLLPSLFSCCHFQFNANRWEWKYRVSSESEWILLFCIFFWKALNSISICSIKIDTKRTKNKKIGSLTI